MALVFVSYSRKDEEFVFKLVKDLRENSVPIWLDQVEIRPGARWDMEIEKALDVASHMLLIMSQSSVESQNVRDELDIAVDDGKSVIPVLIDDCKPPLRVRRMQYTDFRADYDKALARLLKSLPTDKPTELTSETSLASSTPQWADVITIVQKIGVQGDSNALEILQTLLKHPSESIQETARKAIAALTPPQQSTGGEQTSGPQNVKFVITGCFGAGKTTFIQTLSEIEVVSTDKVVSDGETTDKAKTTVAMDFGRLTVDDDLLIYLFGTPGQKRFDFMWEILAEGMLGFVVIIDSSDPGTFQEAKSIMETFHAYAPTPFVIALNKQDKAEAVTPDQFRELFGAGDDIKIVPSVALNPDSARNVLLELIYLVLEEMETK